MISPIFSDDPPCKDPDTTTSPPNTAVPAVDVPLDPADPDTKKFVSVKLSGSGLAPLHLVKY